MKNLKKYFCIGKPVKIDGLLGKWASVGLKYNYEKNKIKCPACGGIGICWQGWFNCECCDVKALIETGEVIMPIRSIRGL